MRAASLLCLLAVVSLLLAPAVTCAGGGASSPDSPFCKSARDACVAAWNAANSGAPAMQAGDVKSMSCVGQYPFTLPGGPPASVSSAGFYWYLELHPPFGKGYPVDLRCRMVAKDHVSTPTVQSLIVADNEVANAPSEACKLGARRCVAAWNAAAGTGPYMVGNLDVKSCVKAATGRDWKLAVSANVDTPPGTSGPSTPPTITCTMTGAAVGSPTNVQNSLSSTGGGGAGGSGGGGTG